MAGKEIIVDTNAAEQFRDPPASTSIVSWVITRVRDWEDHRKQNYDKKWNEYYRMWRGIWDQADKSRESERSRLIHPALSQAIDSTVAEIEEAMFGQKKWFDVSDDATDQNEVDIAMWRDQLAEDFTREDVESALSEIVLNGTIYGTGIGKIILNEVEEKTIAPQSIGDSGILKPTVHTENTIRVGLTPVHPQEFVIDPTARTIDDALGMAHITEVTKHDIQRKQMDGTYKSGVLSTFTDDIVGSGYESQKGELKTIREEDKVLLIEYHGFVPKHLLDGVRDEDAMAADEAEVIETDEEALVEAIVTIANGGTLLRAVENSYLMGDRCFVAYPHKKVPNRFWGRGVAEEGYNPQKGLDAEMRGRIDAMALSIHPMMAMDATRLHRGADLRVAPGRNILTNGSPKDILMPFNFGQVNPSTFNQSADLERQVQMSTGAMDSATPVGENRRNETFGGMSMIQGAAIKRNKRTLANIERKFTTPFINKAAWRYMQFAPERYPVEDIKFNVHSTLGIVAREMEQQQLANLMKTVPSESPAFWMLLKGVFEHSDVSSREEYLMIIDQMMKQSLQKQAQPEPDPLVQIKMKEMEIDAQLEAAKLKQKAGEDEKDFLVEVEKLKIERDELRLKEQKIILDAKIALAAQEQDSLVTAVQMSQKDTKDKLDLVLKASQMAAKEPSVVQVGGSDNKQKKRKVKVQRTDAGLQGIIEEIQDAPERQNVNVKRTPDGLEAVVG